MRFASELPYPEVETGNSVSESKLLMPCYAGMGGELSAIATYCFQSFMSEGKEELENTLNGIRIVEMKHFDMLGRAIRRLGGYPIMGARTYWNGNMANYTLDPRKFILQNIESEKATIKNYERTILNLSSDSAKLLIERIILDEQMHVEAFENLAKMLQ